MIFCSFQVIRRQRGTAGSASSTSERWTRQRNSPATTIRRRWLRHSALKMPRTRFARSNRRGSMPSSGASRNCRPPTHGNGKVAMPPAKQIGSRCFSTLREVLCLFPCWQRQPREPRAQPPPHPRRARGRARARTRQQQRQQRPQQLPWVILGTLRPTTADILMLPTPCSMPMRMLLHKLLRTPVRAGGPRRHPGQPRRSPREASRPNR
mmetsp:Transcript_147005/g.382054  ORF Transcript_147005/g.382054 Transcript_147005/m.382054 type:complete len:209 (-) Transcript_147005:509-1135(-)